jgi:hypothetical protein
MVHIAQPTVTIQPHRVAMIAPVTPKGWQSRIPRATPVSPAENRSTLGFFAQRPKKVQFKIRMPGTQGFPGKPMYPSLNGPFCGRQRNTPLLAVKPVHKPSRNSAGVPKSAYPFSGLTLESGLNLFGALGKEPQNFFWKANLLEWTDGPLWAVGSAPESGQPSSGRMPRQADAVTVLLNRSPLPKFDR